MSKSKGRSKVRTKGRTRLGSVRFFVAPVLQTPARRTLGRFYLQFILSAGLGFFVIEFLPEAYFSPLNRLLAFMVGEVMRPLSVAALVVGPHISIGQTYYQVVSECSAVHLIVLFAAFVCAFPASCRQKWIGLLVGSALIQCFNILRIAAVTLTGYFYPRLFWAAHTYGGQLVMLLATVMTSLAWCRWSLKAESSDGVVGFLLRFVAYSAIPFMLCLPLNRLYLITIDRFFVFLLSLIAPDWVVRQHQDFSYLVFSLIIISGLILAVDGINLQRRLRWLCGGLTLSAVFHFSFRLCNVLMAAYSLNGLIVVARLLYHVCIYALPVLVLLGYYVRVRPVLVADSK